MAVQQEETVMQRYHRLKHEVADLITDVDQLKVIDTNMIVLILN